MCLSFLYLLVNKVDQSAYCVWFYEAMGRARLPKETSYRKSGKDFKTGKDHKLPKFGKLWAANV